MPAVHIKISLRTVDIVGVSNLTKSAVWRGKLGIFTVYVKVVRTAKVIFGAGSAYGGKISVPSI